VSFDATDRGYVVGFPWSALTVALRQGLDARGIEMELASGNETPEPLEGANDA
jgi:hypothetical protein